ncbi:MAG: sulfatase-like hydrolase/transferase [Nitrospinae bacterium]|nr:sulfatase-like hydrolase/transferase [Nitrospinota bacterium]
MSPPQHLKGFKGEFDVRCANDLAKAWRRGIFPTHLKEDVIALYDGEIRLVDDQLRQIFAMLKSSGVYDDTVIVILSDHGEVLFELYKNRFFKKGPGHTTRYSDASIRIPLIIKPAEVPQSDSVSRPSSLVSSIDLVPTILELLNQEPAPWMSGKSLVPLMDRPDPSESSRKIFFHESPHGTEFLGLRSKNWKLIIKNDKGVKSKLLTDLQNDPDEHWNVLAKNSQKGDELEKLLESWKQENKSVNLSSHREMSEEMRKALIDGGYIRD